jgi:phenylacetate-coenzyme A ligase PaaK-like adenylate-forming protein
MSQPLSLSNRTGAPYEWETSVRALGQKLATTELLPPDRLRAYRAPLAARLLAHAQQHTPFYRDRIAFDVASPGAIDRFWPEIPVLRRAEAMANRGGLFSTTTPAEHGRVKDGETSGSTGMPLKYRTTQALDTAICALTERMFRWWRADGKKAFAQISQHPTKDIPTPQGLTTRGWYSARPKGAKYFLSHAFDIDIQLDWLLARRPAYLATFSGIIKELALAAQRRGVELELDLIFSGAAPVDDDLRALCRSVFGAEIADTYGAQETGHIASQCPSCGEYHCSSDAMVVEILRDDGSPAASGETGRVIVTPLYNYAMPLIRYELGDLAEVGSAQPACPRKLPTVRRIFGRYRNLFRFRDGTTIWPVSTKFYLQEFMKLRQFQIIQIDFDNIEIKYVPEGAPEPVQLPALTQRVRAVLGQPVNVTVCSVDKIERTATGKYEDCISLVPSA